MDKAVAKAAPPGSGFDGVGKVTMHAGQPCTPQIMFDFHGAHSSRSVWLAARMNETKLLTGAARVARRVHVWGVWKRGKDKNCNYVDVTKVEPQK
jgi:hypothetical protein